METGNLQLKKRYSYQHIKAHMKKIFIALLFLTVTIVGRAQTDTADVLKAMQKMENAFVNKDGISLNALLHPDLAYGHSNTWVQSKNEVVADMASGKTVYQKFENLSMSISIHKKYATVKERVIVEGVANGNNFKINLFVLHLWVKNKKGWQLLSRQGVKL